MGAETLIGKGIYSIGEAARLTRIPSQRIRRWIGGYDYTVRHERRRSQPVIVADYANLPEASLSFGDLIEIRFVNQFRDAGVSWRSIRVAARRASDVLRVPHPFSTTRFRTDGRTILLELRDEAPDLIDLVTNQRAFGRVLAPYLWRGLDLTADDVVSRWWPMDRRHQVVLDPARAFGQPIVDEAGVPTSILATAFRVEGSLPRVARLYEVDEAAVRDAVEFERGLAEAA